MSSTTSLDCNICCSRFTLWRHAVGGECGHSFCAECVNRINYGFCPVCRDVAFAEPTKNILADQAFKYLYMRRTGGDGAIQEIKHLETKIVGMLTVAEKFEKMLEEEERKEEKRVEAAHPRNFQRHLLRPRPQYEPLSPGSPMEEEFFRGGAPTPPRGAREAPRVPSFHVPIAHPDPILSSLWPFNVIPDFVL